MCSSDLPIQQRKSRAFQQRCEISVTSTTRLALLLKTHTSATFNTFVPFQPGRRRSSHGCIISPQALQATCGTISHYHSCNIHFAKPEVKQGLDFTQDRPCWNSYCASWCRGKHPPLRQYFTQARKAVRITREVWLVGPYCACGAGGDFRHGSIVHSKLGKLM